MDRDKYDKELIKWVKDHYWDSLEKDKDLILRHLRTFAGDDSQASKQKCSLCRGTGIMPGYFEDVEKYYEDHEGET